MNKKINSFLDRHSQYYEELRPDNIRKKIKYGYYCSTDQIYCHLKLIKKERSAYFSFCKIIEKYFNLSASNILEVSCGLIPILSYYLKNDFHVKNITAINDKLVFQPYKNIDCHECDIFNVKDIKNYDLLIGFRPCKATERIIDLCFKSHKDFAVYLCPCDMQPYDKKIKCATAEEWRNYIINKVKNNCQYEIQVIIDHTLQDNLPVIIAKYKKNLQGFKA